MPRLVPLALLLALTASARTDDRPDTRAGDRMIDRYLARLAEDLGGRFLDGAKTRDEWEKKRPRLHREYLDMLGLWPLPERTPLHATVTGTVEHAGVVIEKLHYQSRPGLYVTANLYRPREPHGKLPAILYVCGHAGRGRDGNKTAFQDHGLWFANNGYVCLIVDTLQLGEIPGVHHGTYNRGRWWWQARGYTPAGVECWNGIRGIDYLVSRPDVDPRRIGVTGISGGGAATFWIAAADERVRAAVPVSGMSDLESYVAHKVINGHCDCMFMVNTYQWDWTTIAALVAPRPLLFANSDRDTIFPMDGNRRVLTKLRQLYRTYDRPELVDAYVSKGGHEDRIDLRVAAFGWMNRHLKNDTTSVKYEPFKPLPGKELRVFPEDKDVPKDALNGKIDETFVPKAKVRLPAAGKFAEWKRELMKELRAKSFRWLPDSEPLSAARPVGGPDPLHVSLAGFETEPDVKVFCSLPNTAVPEQGTATLAVLNPGEPWSPDRLPKGIQEVAGKDAMVFLPRGVGTPWTSKSPPNYVARAHALLGRTIDGGRVWDVLAILRRAAEHSKGKVRWKLVGRGQAGVIAAYAALFEPSVKEVVILDPPTSHHDGPIFLNVLRVLDIPEALGMLAPNVKLTLIHGKARAFDRTAQLYKLAGAESNFKR